MKKNNSGTKGLKIKVLLNGKKYPRQNSLNWENKI